MSIELEEWVIRDLIHNVQHFKVITKDLTDQLQDVLNKENPVLHIDVYKSYYDNCKQVMLKDICERFKCEPETVKGILDDLSLKEYLK